jgi:hypothetical protein
MMLGSKVCQKIGYLFVKIMVVIIAYLLIIKLDIGQQMDIAMSSGKI